MRGDQRRRVRKLKIGVIDLVAETRAVCESYAEQARAKGLALGVHLPGAPVLIRFDLSGYRMVLSNLLSNGIKYTREGVVDLSLSVGALAIRARTMSTS